MCGGFSYSLSVRDLLRGPVSVLGGTLVSSRLASFFHVFLDSRVLFRDVSVRRF